MSVYQTYSEVKYEKFVSFEQENLPHFINQIQLNYSTKESGDPTGSKHHDIDTHSLKVVADVLVYILHQHFYQTQATLQVR